MPSLYSTVADYQQSPVGVSQTAFWSNLQAGVLDHLLMEASDAVDSFTLRKLGAPGTTTLNAAANQGDTTLSVRAATGIYANDIITIGTETIEVDGAQVTDYTTPPYVGTIYLNTPLAGVYAFGTTVTVYRQDRIGITGKSTNTQDELVAMSQAGQMARMHAPKGSGQASARKIFLKQYPLLTLKAGFQSLPWTNAENQADFSGTYLAKNTGILTLPIGYFNPLGSHWRIQYIGGYRAIPQDVKDATHLYLASMVARALNPIGANIIRNEGQQAHMTRASVQPGQAHPPRTLFVEEAERLLARYRRKGR